MCIRDSIDDGKISAEGTPLELKNIYTGDYITIYDVDEKDIKALDVEYCLLYTSRCV